ncbi:MAG: LL-diaminopimelate aminotransferase [Paludibacteraceae bacterium]|nr:LL-diaminopimelate aminotransferase [Paludibacteraceae bacterium]
MRSNLFFQHLQNNYLFSEVKHRIETYQIMHPQAHILRLGVGDVTLPLPAPIIDAMHQAVEELGHAESFRGYSQEEGYIWLRQAIIDNDYRTRGVQLDLDEVFVSDGAGSDLGNLSELFDQHNRVAIPDPSYPAYIDASLMAGRNITLLPCSADNAFVPDLPPKQADIIYLCYPNNPTGTVLTREQLQQWVDYARQNHSIIIYDGAYEAYIEEDDIPHSIYEIDGAKEVAIEVRSYSKTAGFTSVRCGYTIVPKQTGLQTMWLRRQCTKYNGTSYIAQRAAEATYTPQGKKATQANVHYYKQTAKLLRNGLQALGFQVYGGINAPYIWCKTPQNMSSWEFFDYLLNQCHIACTPGVGFGQSGEGFIRFSAFSNRKDCEEAIKRIKKLA